MSGQGGAAAMPPAPGLGSAAAVPGLRRRSRVVDRVSRRGLLAGAAINVVLVALVVVFLLTRAWPTVTQIGIGHFFGSTDWDPDAGIGFGTGAFGALAPIFGSFAVVILA